MSNGTWDDVLSQVRTTHFRERAQGFCCLRCSVSKGQFPAAGRTASWKLRQCQKMLCSHSMDLGSVSNVKTKNSCVVHVLQAFWVMMQNSDVEKKKS